MNTEPQPIGQVPDEDPTGSLPTEALGEQQPHSSPAAPPAPTLRDAGAGRTAVSRRVQPRTGPIVWGALILAFCGYVAQRTLYPGLPDTTTWITATVIGLGLLLLGVGAAVLIRNRRP
ncbi:hypothetical protein G7066_03750 [Leucobacter coleopterorum]|uniref:LPXTG-motif cell wall anchor domain-containing protein n=1 Tax=Leucobacter coleopterorum TaxID=2714933 RepID=A0ABX6JUQ5_9MICO|nr:hypothetical protein [Leucobacter coleopterorum]QIM18010.1 hypothetical protein G7066_03750 [Leucobacter coleopterorum]